MAAREGCTGRSAVGDRPGGRSPVGLGALGGRDGSGTRRGGEAAGGRLGRHRGGTGPAGRPARPRAGCLGEGAVELVVDQQAHRDVDAGGDAAGGAVLQLHDDAEAAGQVAGDVVAEVAGGRP